MLLWRVFPHDPSARAGEPGHPLYVPTRQGRGRWDNPDRYRIVYLAGTAEGALVETFGDVRTWRPEMLLDTTLPNARRCLGCFQLDDDQPLCDLDDPVTLSELAVRPSRVVRDNLPYTQGLAGRIHDEGRWVGLSWWSPWHAHLTIHAVWDPGLLRCEEVVAIEPGLPAFREAVRVLVARVAWDD
jgi:hypothetical protein